MAANFHFVPRSVSHKPSKTRQTSQGKPRSVNITSTEIEGTSLTASRSNRSETGEKTSEKNSVVELGSSASFVSEDNQGESDGDSSDIVYFSKNQRWPEDDEPVCAVCCRYGEFICDETDTDVCSKECKAKNLQRIRSAERQQGEKSQTLDCIDKRSRTKQMSSKTIAEKNGERILQTSSFASPETGMYKYTVHPQIASLTEEQVNELRNCMEISIRGDNIERPIMEFSQCGLTKQLYENLKTCGYVTPTPVQMQVIPVALAGRDLLACAQTGSGKTAAFLVPMITRIHYNIGRYHSVI